MGRWNPLEENYCSYCGRGVGPKGALFCPRCGRRLRVVPHIGHGGAAHRQRRKEEVWAAIETLPQSEGRMGDDEMLDEPEPRM